MSAMARFSIAALGRRLRPGSLRRRPPFALVLVAIAAAMAGAFLLVGGGSGSSPGGATHPPPPKFVGSGPSRGCVTAHAASSATRTTTIHIPVQASAPASATARATVGRVTVTATVKKSLVERATVSRKLIARQSGFASRRACVRAGSAQAAHTAALNKAYRAAVSAARADADREAAKGLANLVRDVRPATRAQAQRTAAAAAQTAAASARQALASEALAEATARARGEAKRS